MSKLLIAIFITIVCARPGVVYAANKAIRPERSHSFSADKFQSLLKDPGELKISNVEKIVGRKLRFREKIQLIVLKKQLNRSKKKIYYEADPDKQALVSLIAGSVVLIIVTLGLFNLITGIAFLVLIPALAVLALWLGLRSARSGKNFKNMFGIIAGGLVILTGVAIALGALIFGVV
jgi:lipopolysaccharide export LptBFGC system permease protein LptF